jgi:hypothetical protein
MALPVCPALRSHSGFDRQLILATAPLYLSRCAVLLRTTQGTRTMSATTLRASYSISAPILQRFNAVVPPGERSRLIEACIEQALLAREQELEGIAAAFMSDPANAEAIADEKLWDVTIGDGLDGTPA